MNTVVQLRASQSEKPTVRGGRAKNTYYRQREYLTEGEIDSLMATAGNSRNPVRDRLLILMAFRHALRVSELVDIRNGIVPIRAAGRDGRHKVARICHYILNALARGRGFRRNVGFPRSLR